MENEIKVAAPEKPKSFLELIDEIKERAQKDRNKRPFDLDKLVRSTIEKRPLSYSSLKQFYKSPRHYIEYITGEKTPPTPAMVLGNVLDCMLLTPQDFEDTYNVMPVFLHDGRTKAGKEERAAAAIAGQGKISITDEMYRTSLGMLKSLYNDNDAMQYIEHIKYAQSTIIWTDPKTKLKSISKLDAQGNIEEPNEFIMDLKSAADAEEGAFIRQAHNLDYHLQAGGYTLAVKRKFFRFPDYINIVVESKAPYAVNVFKATSEYLETSQEMYEFLLLAFDMCLKENLWHMGHSFWRLGTPYFQMKLPGYFKSKLGQ